MRYISKYLVQVIPSATPKTSKTSVAGKRVSGARILTSEQCMAIFPEQEEKRRKRKRERWQESKTRLRGKKQPR